LSKATDVMQGTLDLLVLKALSLSPLHGWGISSRVEQISGGTFKLGQGTLYPALHRFEARGWVTSYWLTTENNRIARYYQLTPPGRRAMGDELAKWRAYADAMDLVIDAT
jgi:PadR family transcriptional regulator, regulatory protein PadR